MKKMWVSLSANLGWEELRAIGSSRVFRSSYFWFFFVPIVAKLKIYLAEKSAKSALWGLLGSFELPFSWQIFFFSAMFISIGNIVYFLWCPALIRRYADFTQFDVEGRGKNEILSAFRTTIMKSTSASQAKEEAQRTESDRKMIGDAVNTLKSFNLNHGDDTIGNLDTLPIPQLLSRLTIKDSEVNGAFWSARTYANTLTQPARMITAGFYAVGLGFFALLIFQNIRTVLKATNISEVLW